MKIVIWLVLSCFVLSGVVDPVMTSFDYCSHTECPLELEDYAEEFETEAFLPSKITFTTLIVFHKVQFFERTVFPKEEFSEDVLRPPIFS